MTTEKKQAILDYLSGRGNSYRRLFDLNNQDAVVVLKDLARFCRAGVTVYEGNTEKTHMSIGRNEVWQRIMQQQHLSTEQLYNLIHDTPPKQE